MRALGKFLLQQADNLAPGAAQFLSKYKVPLGVAGGAAGAYGASKVAEPYVDEFMTNRAIEGIGGELGRGLEATEQFGEEHPMALAALLGGGALAGKALGGGDPQGINLNTILGATQEQGMPPQHRRRR